jgi:hypothetical protein
MMGGACGGEPPLPLNDGPGPPWRLRAGFSTAGFSCPRSSVRNNTPSNPHAVSVGTFALRVPGYPAHWLSRQPLPPGSRPAPGHIDKGASMSEQDVDSTPSRSHVLHALVGYRGVATR